MEILGKREPLLLLFGDLIILAVSLYLALALRYLELPRGEFLASHLVPFSILFVVWIVVFYIAGLYGKHTLILKTKLPSILLNALLINSLLAITFFYFVPLFGITPKTILFIYLGVSFVLVLIWRFFGYKVIGSRKWVNAILIGEGNEAEELRKEVNNNDIYNIRFVDNVEDASVAVVDFSDDRVRAKLPDFYKGIFMGVTFLDLHKVYEDVFDRVPLSLLGYEWFLKNISTAPKFGYDTLKRVMDIVISLPLLILSALLFPFIALAIKLDSKGTAFIAQDRIGQNNKIIRLVKFRSMERNEHDKWVGEGENKVTKVGAVLRKTRLDELPQLWNVVRGDISLIGPRPDILGLGKKLQEEIPYYNVRNIVRPGLSGWAQISQDVVPHSVEETKARLSYDLYYIKNRSFLLDLQIALRTLKTLASRVGR